MNKNTKTKSKLFSIYLISLSFVCACFSIWFHESITGEFSDSQHISWRSIRTQKPETRNPDHNEAWSSTLCFCWSNITWFLHFLKKMWEMFFCAELLSIFLGGFWDLTAVTKVFWELLLCCYAVASVFCWFFCWVFAIVLDDYLLFSKGLFILSSAGWKLNFWSLQEVILRISV